MKISIVKDSSIINLYFTALILFFCSCDQISPNIKVESSEIVDSLNLKYYRGKLFTGIMVEKYFMDSSIITETEFKRGKINGYQRQFNNGKLTVEAHFENGIPNGSCKYYFQNGNLSEDLNFENGIIVGKHLSYYDNGMVKVEKNFNKDGSLDGLYTEFKNNGDIVFKAEYKNGEVISYDCKPAETNFETANNLLGVWRQAEKFPDGSYWQMNFYRTENGHANKFSVFKIDNSGAVIADLNNDEGWWVIEEPAKVKGGGRYYSRYSFKFLDCRRITSGNIIFEKELNLGSK